MIYSYNAFESQPKATREHLTQWMIAHWKTDDDAYQSMSNIIHEFLPLSETLFRNIITSTGRDFTQLPTFLQNLEMLDQYVPLPHFQPIFTRISFDFLYADLFRHLTEYDEALSIYTLQHVTFTGQETPTDLMYVIHILRGSQGPQAVPKLLSQAIHKWPRHYQIHAHWCGLTTPLLDNGFSVLYPYDPDHSFDTVQSMINEYLTYQTDVNEVPLWVS